MPFQLLQRAARAVLAGLATSLLLACSGGGAGGEDAVSGSFIDQPVQGLIYKADPATGWTALTSAGIRSWTDVAWSTDGTKLVAVARNSVVFTSSDGGKTWTARESSGTRDWHRVASSADGSKLVAVSGDGIYTSSDSGRTWTDRKEYGFWFAVASSLDGSKLVAGDHIGRLLTSSDSGRTWTVRSPSGIWTDIASSFDGSTLVASSYGGNIYVSNDSGATWSTRATAKSWTGVASSFFGDTLVAGVHGGGVYTSADYGVTWTQGTLPRGLWTGFASSGDGRRLVAVDTTGLSRGQVYTSSDSGLTWTARGPQADWVRVISSFDGRSLVALPRDGYIHTYREPPDGVTGAGGRYTCTTGADVTFYLGSFVLGSVKCGEAVHVYQMAGSGSSISKGLRIAQLLQSLDLKTVAGQITLPDMSGITIDANLLDPNDDDAAFTTKANALLAAVQAANPGKTFTLVTPAAAQTHVSSELAKLSADQKAALCKVNNCNSQLLPLLLNPQGVSGNVSGLPEGKSIRLQLTLASTATQTLNVSANGRFGFPNVDPINDLNKAYSVVRTDTNESVTCSLSNASGTLGASGVSGVLVSCAAVPTKDSMLSGTITGLTAGQSVTIRNGTDTLTVTSNGSFALPAAVGAGLRYAVTTADPVPAHMACTVTNSGGIAPILYGTGSNSIANIAVSCVTPPVYTVSGTIFGLLEGDSVTLAVPSGTGNGTTSLTLNGSSAPTTPYTTAGLASGTTWSVSVISTSANVTCAQGGGVTTAGTIASADVTGVDFGCSNATSGGGGGGGGDTGGGGSTPLAGSVRGSITLGAGVDMVRITNVINAETSAVEDVLLVVSGATTFTMGQTLNGGDSYNISAGDLNGGTSITCSLVNYTGVMPQAAATPNYVADVSITCNLTGAP